MTKFVTVDDILNGNMPQPEGASEAVSPDKTSGPKFVTVQDILGDQTKSDDNALPTRSFGDAASDAGIKLAQGVVGGLDSASGLVNLATFGGLRKAQKALGLNPNAGSEIVEDMGTHLSAQQQEAEKHVSDAKGFIPTAKALLERPAAIAGDILESLPPLALPAGAARSAMGDIVLNATKKAAMAEGATEATIAAAGKAAIEDVANQAKIAWANWGATGAQAAGTTAQTIAKENPDDPTAIYWGVPAGIFTAVVGRVAGKIMGDPETALFSGIRGIGPKGTLPVRVAKGALEEGGIFEPARGYSDKVFENLGTDTPEHPKEWNEGASESSARSAVAGFGMGGGAAILHGPIHGKPAPETGDVTGKNGTVWVRQPDGSLLAKSPGHATTAEPDEEQAAKARAFAANAFAKVDGDESVQMGQASQRATVAAAIDAFGKEHGHDATSDLVNRLSGGDADLAAAMIHASEDKDLVSQAVVAQVPGIREHLESVLAVEAPTPPPASLAHVQQQIQAVRDGLVHGAIIGPDMVQHLDLNGLHITDPVPDHKGRQAVFVASDLGVLHAAVDAMHTHGLEQASALIEKPVDGKAVVRTADGGEHVVTPTEATKHAGEGATVHTVDEVLAERAKAADAAAATQPPVVAHETSTASDNAPTTNEGEQGTTTTTDVRDSQTAKTVADVDGVEEPDIPEDAYVDGEEEQTKSEAPQKAAKAKTELQQRDTFAKETGAVSGARGNTLNGRKNKVAGAAAQAGDTKGFLGALRKSKNKFVARVAELAAGVKGLKVEVNDDKRETRDAGIGIRHSAIAHLIMVNELDGMRSMREAVEAHKGRGLPKAPDFEVIPADIDGGLNAAVNLRSYLSRNDVHSREQFLAKLDKLEKEAAELGEDNLRRSAGRVGMKIGAIDGMWDTTTKTVSIASHAQDDEKTHAHELGHAVVQQAIDNPTAEQKPVVAELEKLFQHVKENYGLKDDKNPNADATVYQNLPEGVGTAQHTHYGLSSLHEFVSEAWGNPEFQYFLSRIKYESQTVWSAFVEAVSKLFGVEHRSALSEAIALSEKLAELANPKTEAKTETKSEAKSGQSVLFSRDQTKSAVDSIRQNEDLFKYPKGQGKTIEAVAKSINPGIEVIKGHSLTPNQEMWYLEIPDFDEDGNLKDRPVVAMIKVRENEKGKVYSADRYGYGDPTHDADPRTRTPNRPGTSLEAPHDGRGDVILDVSDLRSGEGGGVAYAIAADFAKNTGRVFVGDPQDLSDKATVRRTEHMLSSALKHGTTEHLAPHPIQMHGNKKLGIPPLKWKEGDHENNILRMIAVSAKAGENLGHNVVGFSDGEFRDSEGRPIDREGINLLAKQAGGFGRTLLAGGTTAARGAILRAVLQGEGGSGRSRGGRNGVLERLGNVTDNAGPKVRGVFYSRNPTKPLSAAQVNEIGRTGVNPNADLSDDLNNQRWADAFRKAKSPAERAKMLAEMKADLVTKWFDARYRAENWMDKSGLPANLRQAANGALVRSDTMAAAMEKEVFEKYMEKSFKAMREAAKLTGFREDDMRLWSGLYATARYVPEANTYLLNKSTAALQTAQAKVTAARATLAAAQTKNDPVAIAAANKAVTAAQAANAKAHQELNDLHTSIHGAVGAAKPGKTAGGLNNAEAAAYMRDTRARIEAALQKKGDPNPSATFDKLMDGMLDPLYDMLEWSRDESVRAGRVSQAQVNSWPKKRHYVPLTGDPRATADSDDVFDGGGNKVNQTTDKSMKGRSADSAPADDAFTAALGAVRKTINFSAFQPYKVKLGEAMDYAKANGLDIGMTRSPAIGVISPGGNHVIYRHVVTLKNGQERIKSEVFRWNDARIPDAIRKASVERANSWLGRGWEVGTRWYARAVTQLQLAFAPLNFIRDVWERQEIIRIRDLVDDKGNKVNVDRAATRSILYALHPEVWLAAVDKVFHRGGMRGFRNHLEQLVRIGGLSVMSGHLATNASELDKQVRGGLLDLPGLKQSRKLFELWNHTFEMVPPLAMFMSLKKEGMTPEDAAAAVLKLMNFKQQGTALPGARALYVFTQPAAASGYNMAQYLSTKKGMIRIGAQIAIGYALYGLLRGAWSGDHDDETGNPLDNMSNFVVERSIPIKLFGHVLKFPVGFGPPQLAWMIAATMHRIMSGRYTGVEGALELGKGWVKSFAAIAPSDTEFAGHPLAMLAQTFTPTILKPLVNIALDTTALGGQLTPFIKSPDKLKSDQANRTTPNSYKEMAHWIHDNTGIDMYPDHIKALMDGYIVGLFHNFVTWGIDNPAKVERGEPTPMPFIAPIFDTLNDRSILNSVYGNLKSGMDQNHREFKAMQEDPEKRGDITETMIRQEQSYEAFRASDKAIGALRSSVQKMRGKWDDETFSERIQRIENRADDLHLRLIQRYYDR